MKVDKEVMQLENEDLLEEIKALERNLQYYNSQISSMNKSINHFQLRQTYDGARFYLLMEEAKYRKLSGKLENEL